MATPEQNPQNHPDSSRGIFRSVVSAGETSGDIRVMVEDGMKRICRIIEKTGSQVYANGTFELKRDADTGNTYSLSWTNENGVIENIECFNHKSIMELAYITRSMLLAADEKQGPEVTLEDLAK